MTTLNIPSTDTLSLPQQLTRLDLDRQRAYRENLEFYGGVQWQGTPRRGERRLTFNYAKLLVEKLTSYLVSGTSFSIEPLDPLDGGSREERARESERAVRQVYEANGLEELDFETELDTAILGDGCYKLTWDPQEERVRITSPDVQGIYAWWVGDDPSQVWRVASRYVLSAEAAETLYGINPAHPRQEVTVVEGWTPAALPAMGRRCVAG